MQDTIITTLRAISGKGPQHWEHVRDTYCAMGGTPKQFTEDVYAMQAKYPNRLIITRPYNLSASPTLEVPGEKRLT